LAFQVAHTKNYMQVLLEAKEGLLGGSVYVRITSVSRWSVMGEVLDPQPKEEDAAVVAPQADGNDEPAFRQTASSKQVGSLRERQRGVYEGIEGQNSAVARGLGVSDEECACGSTDSCCSSQNERLKESAKCACEAPRMQHETETPLDVLSVDKSQTEMRGSSSAGRELGMETKFQLKTETETETESKRGTEAKTESVATARTTAESGTASGEVVDPEEKVGSILQFLFPAALSTVDLLLLGGVAVGCCGLLATGFLWAYT
jgi:hypothetical protein